MKAALNKAHILIADSDRMMAEVLKETLHRMGLDNVTRVRSGREAIDVLKQKHVDILITEWEMKPVDGLSLIKTIRQAEEARFAMLPVIMLTGRAEMVDVVEARDAGATEFLVKPFTAKTLFNRLEHVIDFPRDFIVSEKYVGPDRRRSRQAGKMEERRVTLPIVLPEPVKMPLRENSAPQKIIPSHALKKKLGIIDSLNKVITADILQNAQAQIASFQDESLKWIADDLAMLENALQQIYSDNNEDALEAAKEALLSLKSRAGTFGFGMASQIAFAFYVFLRNKFTFGNASHLLIIRKHIEVLKIILARKVVGAGGQMEQQLVEGLSLLTQKLQDADLAH